MIYVNEGLDPEKFADLPTEELEVLDPRSLLSSPGRAFHRFVAALHTYPAIEEAFFGVRRSWAMWISLALLSVATEDHVERWITVLVAGTK